MRRQLIVALSILITLLPFEPSAVRAAPSAAHTVQSTSGSGGVKAAGTLRYTPPSAQLNLQRARHGRMTAVFDPSSCPTGWTCNDVGGSTPQGSDSESGGVFTLDGGGNGFPVQNGNSSFNYVWQPLAASGSFSARLVSYNSNLGPSVQEAVMVRPGGAGDDGQAPFFAVVARVGQNGQVYGDVLWRRYEGGPVQYGGGGASYSLPVTFQVTRSGLQYTGLINGTSIISFALDMPGTLEAGMAVDSGGSGQLNQTTFDTVSLTPGDPTPIQDCPSDWDCTEVNQDSNPPSPSPAPGGESTTDGKSWVLNGPGWGFAGAWGDGSDQFRYVYRSFSGGTLAANLVQHNDANGPWDDTGIMVRQSTSGKAPYYFAAVETDINNNGAYVIHIWDRLTQGGGGGTVTILGDVPSLPYLVISDSNGTFSTSYSLNGGSLQPVPNSTETDPTWNGSGLAGMAATGSGMETAEFNGVSMSPSGITSPDTSTMLGADGASLGPTASQMSTQCSCGPPVNTATGDFWHAFTDISIPGRGIPLDFNHTYNSLLANQDSPLGFGWTDSYNMFLTTDSSGNITVHQETGSSITFTYANSVYQAPNWVFATLVYNAGSNTFTFTRLHGGDQYTFAAPTQNTPGDLQQEQDRNGYVTALAYNGSGQLQSVTDPAGRKLTFSYNDTGVNANHITGISTTVANPSPITVAFGYDNAGNLTSAAITDVVNNITRTTTFGYDPNHLLTTMIDPRLTTLTNSYNGYWQVTQQVLDPGSSPHLNRVTLFNYVLNQDGSHSTIMTLPKGNRIEYTYQYNELTSLTRGYGSSQAATWTYGYDQATLGLNSILDPNNHTWSAQYDANGNLKSVTDPLQRVTSYTYDSANDLTSVTDPIGNAGAAPCGNAANCTITFQYDAKGNLNCVSGVLVLPNSQTQTLTTSLFYTDSYAGDVTAITDPRGTGGVCLTAPPSNYTTSLGYDADGNLTSVTDAANEITTATYDALGHPHTVVEPPGNAQGGNPSQYTDYLAHDAFGDLTSYTDVIGNVTGYQYDLDGNLQTLTNAKLKQTQYTYDPANELTQVTQPDTGVSSYTSYDSNGNVAEQQDGVDLSNGTGVQYTYDALDRLATMQDRTRTPVTYNFDPAGRLTSVVNPMGQTTTYGYDNANELTCISTTNCSSPTISYGYTLDGQRQSMSDTTGTTSYTYDSLGRLTQTVTGAGTTQYGYDNAGNLTQLIYPGSSNLTVTRQYDGVDRMTSVSDGLSHTTNFSYALTSALSKVSFPNGTTESFTYTKSQPGFLTNITDTKKTTLGQSTIWAFNYGRDPLGLVSTASDSIDSLQHTYSYDELSRFTQDKQVSGGSTTGTPTYVYDAADELKSITDNVSNTISTFSYDTTHQLSSLVTTVNGSTQQNLTLSYNGDGDRMSQSDSVSGASASYGYDQFDELTSFQSGGGPQYTYGYNGDGLRMSKTVNGTTENYVWDVAEGLPLLIQDGSTRYITGPDGLPIEQVDGSGNPTYYYQDQLGSTRGLINQAGTVVGTFTYDAYGRLTGHSGTATTPFGYAGQYSDSESGLQYLRARYYDPTTRQFITVDPLMSVTRQPYAYVADNPLNGTDRSGLLFGLDTDLGTAIGGVVGAVTGAGGYGLNVATGSESFSWRNLAGATVGGGIGGAAAGACWGTVWYAAAPCGAAGSVIGSIATDLVDGRAVSGPDVVQAAAFGAVGGVVGARLFKLQGFRPYKMANLWAPGVNARRLYAQSIVSGTIGFYQGLFDPMTAEAAACG